MDNLDEGRRPGIDVKATVKDRTFVLMQRPYIVLLIRTLDMTFYYCYPLLHQVAPNAKTGVRGRGGLPCVCVIKRYSAVLLPYNYLKPF